MAIPTIIAKMGAKKAFKIVIGALGKAGHNDLADGVLKALADDPEGKLHEIALAEIRSKDKAIQAQADNFQKGEESQAVYAESFMHATGFKAFCAFLLTFARPSCFYVAGFGTLYSIVGTACGWLTAEEVKAIQTILEPLFVLCGGYAIVRMIDKGKNKAKF